MRRTVTRPAGITLRLRRKRSPIITTNTALTPVISGNTFFVSVTLEPSIAPGAIFPRLTNHEVNILRIRLLSLDAVRQEGARATASN